MLNNSNDKIRYNFVSTLFVFHDCVLVVEEDFMLYSTKFVWFLFGSKFMCMNFDFMSCENEIIR